MESSNEKITNKLTNKNKSKTINQCLKISPSNRKKNLILKEKKIEELKKEEEKININ